MIKMKNCFFNVFAMCLMVICLASCGKKSCVTISDIYNYQDDTTCDFFHDVACYEEDSCVIELKSSKVKTTFTFRNRGENNEKLKKAMISNGKILLLLEGGVDGKVYVKMELEDSNEFFSWLKESVEDEIKEFSFVGELSKEEILSKIETVRFQCLLGNETSDADAEESKNSKKYNDEEESSCDSEDWDAVLDDYEEYVDKYIALLKKANQGDMSALSEYVSMMEKAEKLGEKMDGAQGQMSSAQWARYTKILQKMTNAAQSM